MGAYSSGIFYFLVKWKTNIVQVFIFAGAKFGENVLKWDAFIYATKFRAMAIYVILFEREIIIRGLNFSRI